MTVDNLQITATTGGIRGQSIDVRLLRAMAIFSALISLALIITWTFVDKVELWPVTSCILATIALWWISILSTNNRGEPSNSLGPVSVFSAIYFISSAVAPALWTITPLTLPGLSADPAMAFRSVILTSACYFGAAFIAVSGRRTKNSGQGNTGEITGTISGAMPLILIGTVGLWMRFPDLASLRGYFAGDYTELSLAAEGLWGLVSSILRPLLPAGAFIAWANRRSISSSLFLLVTCLVALGSFSLNRAYVAVPILAFIIVYHTRVKRISKRAMAIIGLALIAAFMMTGAVRSTTLNSEGGKYDVAQPFEDGAISTTAHTVQLYAQPALQTGLALASPSLVDFNNIVSSILSPIPGTNEQIRDHTGTREYNRQIYRSDTPNDQILPSHIESWWGLGPFGYIAWVTAVGLAMRALQGLVESAAEMPRALIFTIASLWLAQVQIVSFTVLTQVAIYLTPAAILLTIFARRAQRK